MTTTTQDYRAFLAAALRHPGLVGAVAPSLPALCDQLAAVVPSRGRPVVVELGPGTGVVSAAIRRRLPAGARQLAVELDPAMLAHLERSHPWLEVIAGDAAELAGLLADVGVARVDAVVSGLPWSLFDEAAQRRVLDAVGAVLVPHGVFTTFGYLHALRLRGARRFRVLLEQRFGEVMVSRAVWRNLPPAMTYVCRRAVPEA